MAVEALRYKPEGRGFDSRWCNWGFSSAKTFHSHNGPGVDTASSTSVYQKYFPRCKSGRSVGLTTLPLTCADYLAIWQSQPPGTHRACPDLYRNCFTVLCSIHFKSDNLCRFRSSVNCSSAENYINLTLKERLAWRLGTINYGRKEIRIENIKSCNKCTRPFVIQYWKEYPRNSTKRKTARGKYEKCDWGNYYIFNSQFASLYFLYQLTQ